MADIKDLNTEDILNQAQKLIDEAQKIKYNVDSDPLGELVAKFFVLKSTLDSISDMCKEIKDSQEELEQAILKTMEQDELEKVSTKLGTFTRTDKSHPSVTDIVSFLQWVAEDVDGRCGYITKKLNEKAINDMFREDGILPPGVTTFIKASLTKRSAK